MRAGGRPAIDGSVMKVLWSEARRERAELGVALLGAGGALLDEWPTAAARAVLGHDRRRHERGAPQHDRRTRARPPAGAAGRPRRVVPRARRATPVADEPSSRTASTTTPIRSPRAGPAARARPRRRRPRTQGALTDVGIDAGLALLRHRLGRGHDRGVDGRAGRAETGRVVSIDVDTRFQPPSAGVHRGPHARRHAASRSAPTSSTSCTPAACCSTSRSGKPCSTR